VLGFGALSAAESFGMRLRLRLLSPESRCAAGSPGSKKVRIDKLLGRETTASGSNS
jgi:hypothetical protein